MNSEDDDNGNESGTDNRRRGSDDGSDEKNGGENDPAASFYLRHQNRALASELRGYKRQIDGLVAERDCRRLKCTEAREEVDRLGEIWAEVEASIRTALLGLNLVSLGFLFLHLAQPRE